MAKSQSLDMFLGIPRPRRTSPFWQNVIAGTIVGVTAGIYLALNLLGGGGGKPNSAHTVQVSNATACTVWFFSACFSGSVLNTVGPALTGLLGTIGYIIYVGSLWYFDQTGNPGFPIFAGVAIGLSAGLVFVVMGYMSISYSEESERGKFVMISVNMYATVSAIGGLIPLIINRHSATTAGVPVAVYIIFIVLMLCGSMLSLLLLPPNKITRDNGEHITVMKARTFWQEIKATLEIFKDWKLLLMIPAFLPGETYLVYGGSVNAFHNNLRTRSLLSFIAVVFQILFSIPLRMLFDQKTWKRRTRALAGLSFIGIPLISAWVWEVIRTRSYDRHNPSAVTMDWTDREFIPIFFLFMLNFVSGALWMNVTLYFIGTLTNDPRKAANYAGVFRGVLGAGEAINFGVDSIGVPYVKEAGVILAFFTAGVMVLVYLALFHMKETMYFAEEEVVVPHRVIEEQGQKMEKEVTVVNSEHRGEEQA